MSLKVYIEGGETYGQYADMFLNNGWGLTESLLEADLVQFTGGEDVSPVFYGEEKHDSSFCSVFRDSDTERQYQEAVLNNIPMAGICRGSQFLCAINGGKLWQDVDGHATGINHRMLDQDTGEIIEVSSTHHQQHRPPAHAQVIGVSYPRLTTYKTHMNGDEPETFTVSDDEPIDSADLSLGYDVEAFFVDKTKCLGVQSHPEFFSPDHPNQVWYFDVLDRYLNLRAGE